MTKGSVYEGKTFDDAVQKGLSTLGLARSEAIITVVEEGKGGFLGFGSRPFRVSVARRPGGAIREPEEAAGASRRDRGGRERDRGRGGRDEARRGERKHAGARAEGGRRDGRRDEPRRDEPRRDEPRRERSQPARALEGAREDGRREGRRSERRDDSRPAAPRREGEREPRREAGREPRREAAREPRREDVREPRREDVREPHREEVLEPRQDLALPAPAMAESREVETGDEAADRKRRRRRGRRGGRGRRRPEELAANATGGVAAPPAMVDEEFDEGETEFEAMDDVEVVDVPQAAPIAEAPAPVPAAVVENETRDRHDAGDRPRRERDRGRGRDRDRDMEAAPDRAPDLDEQQLADTSRRLTEDLLKAMGFEATVTVAAQDTRADVTAEVSRDDELLTGRKGEVRQALQHLLNRYLNRGEGSRYHLQLEINDFWQRRETELQEQARGMADSAANERREVVSEYLNSQERRIIHVTLKEDARVRTYALGTGMIKRVAVAPADFPERTEDEPA